MASSEEGTGRIPSGRIIAVTAASVFVFTFIVYLLTLTPSLSSQSDSGELVSAAATLGIAHPPGYPTYTILGYLFSSLPLKGDSAFRMNLMSAFFSSCTIALLFMLGALIFESFAAAISVSLLFAFSLEFWKLSLSAEVFSLHMFFVALIVYLLFRWRNDSALDDGRHLSMYLFFFVSGLSLSHHHTVLFLAPACLFIIIREKMYRPLRNLKTSLICLLLLSAGLIPYIYLPLRSAAHPRMGWEDAGTLEGFRRMVTRAGYGTFSLATVSGESRSFQAALVQAAEYVKVLAAQFGSWLFVVPGCIGIVCSAIRRRAYLFFFLYIFLVYGIVFLLIARFPHGEGYMAVLSRFFLPSFMAFAVFIGMALDPVSGLLKERLQKGRLIPVFNVMVIALPVITLLVNYPLSDRHDNYIARDYGRNLLKGLDEKAIIIVLGDIHSGAALYSQEIEKKRPDVTVLLEGLLTSRWYVEKKAAESPDLAFLLDDQRRMNRRLLILSIILHEKGQRPVYINHPVDDPDIQAECEGLAWRVTTGEKEPFNAARLDKMLNETYSCPGTGNLAKLDYFSRELLRMYSYSFCCLGSKQAEQNDSKKAMASLERALALDQTNDRAMYLLGTLQIRENMLDEAEKTFLTLRKSAEDSREVYTNLAIIYARKGESGKAKEALRRAQQLGGVKE